MFRGVEVLGGLLDDNGLVALIDSEVDAAHPDLAGSIVGQFDAVIAPVTQTPAFPHDHEPDQGKRRIVVNGAPADFFTQSLWPGFVTLPGLPATALPIGRSPEGLPIGAQIIGPWLEDRTPLRLAGLIEREYGGFEPPAI